MKIDIVGVFNYILRKCFTELIWNTKKV